MNRRFGACAVTNRRKNNSSISRFRSDSIYFFSHTLNSVMFAKSFILASMGVFCIALAASSYLIDSSPNQIDWLVQSQTGSRNVVQREKLLNNVEIENLPTLTGRNDLVLEDYKQSSCQLVQIIHLLHYPGCQSKAISSFACSGLCPSYVQVSFRKSD